MADLTASANVDTLLGAANFAAFRTSLKVPASDPALVTDATAAAITNIVSLTQAEYNNIASPSATTYYIITDAPSVNATIAGYMAEQTLTDSATVTYNVTNGVNAKWTRAQASTILFPTNTTSGQSGRVVMTQSGAGPYALTLGTGSEWGLTTGNLAQISSMTTGEIAVLSWTRVTSTKLASTLIFLP